VDNSVDNFCTIPTKNPQKVCGKIFPKGKMAFGKGKKSKLQFGDIMYAKN
jgi:hypothetical protein